MSGNILTSPRPHSESLYVGRYCCPSSTPLGKPIQHKCRELFLPLLGPIRKAYPTQMSGNILASPRPHSESLSNTYVGRYSYLSSAPFGKPIEHKCLEIFLPLLGPIRKASRTQMSRNNFASPWAHSESLSNTNVGKYSCLSSAPFGKPIQHMSGDILTYPRPHSVSLSNTNVWKYSYLSSAPFGKPLEHKCREITLPPLGPIRKAYLTQM
jgi:hypothetical protein